MVDSKKNYKFDLGINSLVEPTLTAFPLLPSRVVQLWSELVLGLYSSPENIKLHKIYLQWITPTSGALHWRQELRQENLVMCCTGCNNLIIISSKTRKIVNCLSSGLSLAVIPNKIPWSRHPQKLLQNFFSWL